MPRSTAMSRPMIDESGFQTCPEPLGNDRGSGWSVRERPALPQAHRLRSGRRESPSREQQSRAGSLRRSPDQGKIVEKLQDQAKGSKDPGCPSWCCSAVTIRLRIATTSPNQLGPITHAHSPSYHSARPRAGRDSLSGLRIEHLNRRLGADGRHRGLRARWRLHEPGQGRHRARDERDGPHGRPLVPPASSGPAWRASGVYSFSKHEWLAGLARTRIGSSPTSRTRRAGRSRATAVTPCARRPTPATTRGS